MNVFISDLGDEMECSLRYVGKKKTVYITPCSNKDKERSIIDLWEMKRLQKDILKFWKKKSKL